MPASPSKESDAPLSAPSRTYEIQRLSQGRWTVDSVSDDKEMALELAKALMRSRRAPTAARVMSVISTESGKFSEISVWRSGQPEPQREAQPAPKPKAEAQAKPAANEVGDFKHTGEHPAPPPKKSKMRNVVYALQAAFGLGISLAAAEAVYLLMR
jgi:hypothetical protein